MKFSMGMLFAALTLFATGILPAFATEVTNPGTGDNSMVTVALIIMAVAAVIIVALLFFTRKKK